MDETVVVVLQDLPVIRPQVINIGDDWQGETFGHTNPDGTPAALTGAVVSGRLQIPGGQIVNLVMNVDVAGGTYTPTLPRSTTEGFLPGTGRFDIDMIDSLGKKQRYWAGPVTFKKPLPPAGV